MILSTGNPVTNWYVLQRDRWHPEFKTPDWGLIKQKPLWENYRPPTLQRQMLVLGAVQHASSTRPGDEFGSLCDEGQLDKALHVLLCMRQQGAVPSVNMYRSLLKACARRKALSQAKRVHAHLAEHELSGYLGESVVITLVKCGGLADAVQVFDCLPQRTVYSWTAVISGYTVAGQGQEALRMYQRMVGEGLEPNKHTFVSLLKACGSIPDLETGKRIHEESLKYGCESDLFVGTSLVDMYAKCGSIVDAGAVFDGLSQRDVVSWNAMLGAFVLQGQAERTLQLYEQMWEEDGSPDVRTLVSAIQACGLLAAKEGAVLVNGQLTKVRSLKCGRAIHFEAWRRAYESDAFVCSTLVSMYCKCGSLLDARMVFDGVSQRHVVSWNAMLAGYAQQGQPDKAFQVYRQMHEEAVSPDDRTLVSVLQACGMLAEMEEAVVCDGRWMKLKSLGEGKAIHAESWRKGYDSDIFVANSLVSMYGKCGSSLDMQNVFDGLPQRNMVSWTAMVTTYAQQGQAGKALDTYQQMLEEGMSPNDRTFASVLQACGMLAEKDNDMLVDGRPTCVESLQRGKAMHAQIWRQGFHSSVLIGNTLVSMYGKCGSVLDAKSAFDGLPDRNVVSWNAILKAYVDQGQAENAVNLYVEMQEGGVMSDVRTFISMLQVCGMLAGTEEAVLDVGWMKPNALSKTKHIQAEAWKAGYKSDVFIGSALISAFGRCNNISDAQSVFYVELRERDLVAWNMMLAAYVQVGLGDEALQLYRQMQEEGVTPNEITFMCMLQLCSQRGTLEVCRKVHRDMVSVVGGNLSRLVTSSLINAYGRCASMVDAQNVLDAINQPDVISWTSLIAGYARQGNWVKSLSCYEEMQVAGVEPNGVTFVALLSACSHGGLVEKGVEYFVSMTRHHGITPEIEHYVSMVDLLGRAGHFTGMYDLLSRMPVKPDLSLLLCLLSACRKHGKVELAEQAFESAVDLSPQHAAAYVLMSNIYANAGLWDCAKEVDELRQQAGAWKECGQSWVVHQQEVHIFVVGEHLRPTQPQLHDMLVKFALELQAVA